ncbi:sulfotransferase family 2 domain-containing protein [Parahaliea mediterranea]|uniref:sulfotransferase family 2 domain-containing protein n=1 Tax=Parahaliea mediterranea TaxID=651086 RepID=UPI000E2EB861|nr:sulfotransferase family 2 domain-containing protein [Parahaliea mediterranea]
MLISVHLPKTAGSSFHEALREAYGDQLYADYGDQPLNTPQWPLRLGAVAFAMTAPLKPALRKHVACVHGHFLPLKYATLSVGRTVQYVTWLRDPLDRLLSHYHYWRDTPMPPHAGPVRRQFEAEQWSLEAFCLAPSLRNLYSRFLWGFPLKRFDFVGITEHYEEDLDELSERLLHRNLPHLRHNVTPQRANQAPRELLSPGLIESVRTLHGRDFALYEEALAMRAHRRAARG